MGETNCKENLIKEIRDNMIMAVDTIDKEFGKGYADSHPEILAAFMNSLSMSALSNELEDIEKTINGFKSEIISALSTLIYNTEKANR